MLDDRGGHEPKICRTCELALTHRNTAGDLGEVLAQTNPDQELLERSKLGGAVHPLGISRDLADRFHVSGKPGEPVGGALLAFEQTLHGMGSPADALAHGSRGIPEHGFSRARNLAGHAYQFYHGTALITVGQHRLLDRYLL